MPVVRNCLANLGAAPPWHAVAPAPTPREPRDILPRYKTTSHAETFHHIMTLDYPRFTLPSIARKLNLQMPIAKKMYLELGNPMAHQTLSQGRPTFSTNVSDKPKRSQTPHQHRNVVDGNLVDEQARCQQLRLHTLILSIRMASFWQFCCHRATAIRPIPTHE